MMMMMFGRPSLENRGLTTLYEAEREPLCERDEDCISQDSEGSSEEGGGGRGLRSSLSLEIHGLQREHNVVVFSNHEYYRRLEELKSNHLRNMAELERMYISPPGEEDGGRGTGRGRGGDEEATQSLSGPIRRLQRINSQEELDFHDTSSGSDQSELCADGVLGELVWTSSQDRSFERDFLLRSEMVRSPQHRALQSRTSLPTHVRSRSRSSSSSRSRSRSRSRPTVPKPFEMMVREEERKKNKVRTRSEVELENTVLRRELEELRECQKKFRASPAPAHIHLPLYNIIARRTSKRSARSRSDNNNNNNKQRDARGSHASAAVPPQPFRFLERERRKREARIQAEFGNFVQKVERRAFRARPMPSSVYGGRLSGTAKASDHQPETTSCALEREATEGQSEPSSDLEPDTSSESCKPQRGSSSSSSSSSFSTTKPVKKQMEVSIEMVKEKPVEASGCNMCSPQPTSASLLQVRNQSDDVSV